DRIFAIVFAASQICARRIVVRYERSSGWCFSKSDPPEHGIDGDCARGRRMCPALAKIGEGAYVHLVGGDAGDIQALARTEVHLAVERKLQILVEGVPADRVGDLAGRYSRREILIVRGARVELHIAAEWIE